MLNENFVNLSKVRFEHSLECLSEAKSLLSNEMYKGAANRAYYAAFHAIRSVLILDEFDSKKHSGIIAKFRELYLKNGVFSKEISDYISSLFRVRTASDYDDFYLVSKDEAAEQVINAERIIDAIQEYLHTVY